MSIGFTPETRAVVRRRIGRLMYPEIHEFFYAGATAVTPSDVTFAPAVLVPDDALVGKILNFPAPSLGQNQPRSIIANTAGRVVPNTNYAPNVSVGDVGEVWPEYTVIEAINEHINLAIQRLSPLIGVYAETTPTINTDLTIIDVPTGWNKLVGVRFIDAYDHLTDYLPTADPWQDPLGPLACTVRGTKIYLNRPIPSGTTEMFVRGYRPPALPVSDTDLLEINPAYAVFMGAFMLDSGRAYGQALDPEQHSARATNWYNNAKDIEIRSGTEWLPHVIPLET